MPPRISDYSLNNDMIPAHSGMYWEGYYAAKDGKPCRCPYNPDSEAGEDFVAGYREYKNTWTPDL